MACCKFRCKRRLTKSDCARGLKNLWKRLASHVTAFKLTQLVLASAGMGLHVWQPFYRSSLDSNLIPGILCSFIIISCVLLFAHLFGCTSPIRLNVTFSTVAVLGYGCCMSSIMDSTKIEEDRTTWIFLLGKSVACFAALAIHLLELLYAFINRDSRPSNLGIAETTRNISRSPSLERTHA